MEPESHKWNRRLTGGEPLYLYETCSTKQIQMLRIVAFFQKKTKMVK